MDIFINGLRITVSQNFVNQHKNNPATCPLCKGKNTNACPIGHPYVKPDPPQPPDPNEWIEMGDDDPFRYITGHQTFGGKDYRRKDDPNVAAILLELKQLGLSQGDVECVSTTIERRIEENEKWQARKRLAAQTKK